MSNLVKAVQDGFKYLKRKDDDSFDRLSNRYTVAFLVACSLFLATKSYVGDPIDCFVPKEFADNWVKYTDNYCWIKNTYYIPWSQDIPAPNEKLSVSASEQGKLEISYYQWVPIILAFMILLFAVPVGVWNFAMMTSGYDIQDVITVANKNDNVDPEKRDKTIGYIAAQFERHISYHRNLAKSLLPVGNKYGRYLFFMYIFTKLLYIAVPIFLLFCLTFMMGDGYSDYGVRAVQGIMKDGDYIENPMFPRVSLCDFRVRRMGGNVHRYTVQCVLTVNLFNERVFLIIWWWLLVLAGLSALGLLVLLVKTFWPGSGLSLVSKYLVVQQAVELSSSKHQRLVRKFSNDYLALDGILCLRLMAQNTTDVVVAEIVKTLFEKWKKKQGKADDSSDEEE